MTMEREGTFAQMAKEFPVRTSIFTVGPVLFALLQLGNSYLHDVSLLMAGGLTAVMVAYSVLVTQYHLAAYRRWELSSVVNGPASSSSNS